MEKTQISVRKTRIRLLQNDITNMKTDAIVNAANSSLMGGGGVDGAIHRKGGPKILEECKIIRTTEWPEGLPTGKAVITSGGNLKARFVIHTVGPIWQGGTGNEPELLAQSYRSSLELALENGLRTIAFPSISTGAYGYPLYEASRVALRTVKSYLEQKDGFEEVVFTLFSNHDLKIYIEALGEIE